MTPDYILFSDASLRSDAENKEMKFCAASSLVLNVKTGNYIKFCSRLASRSIVFAEAWGIYKALQTLMHYVKPDVDVNVVAVTDSKLNVQIINDYIPNKWDLSDWYHWRKADGSEVKNQVLYRRLYRILIDNPNVSYKLIHINSHKSLDESAYIVKKFRRCGVTINNSTAKTMIMMNDIVDQLATNETLSMKYETNDFYTLVRNEGFEYV